MNTNKYSTDKLPYWKGELSLLKIIDASYVPKNSNVFIGGSIVEKHGNPFSDIDIICITPAPVTIRELIENNVNPLIIQLGSANDIIGGSIMGHEIEEYFSDKNALDREILSTHNYIDIWGTRCDIQYVSQNRLNSISRTLDCKFDLLKSFYGSSPLPFTYDNSKLIHTINNAIPFSIKNNIIRLSHTNIDISKFRYCCYRANIFGYAAFQDIIGAILNDNILMAYELSQDFLRRSIMAWLHIAGNSNISTKWIWFYLTQTDAVDEKCLEKVKIFLKNPQIELNYILLLFDLIDLVISDTRRLIDAGHRYIPTEEIDRAMRKKYKSVGRDDPHFHLSLEYYARFSRSDTMPLREFLNHPQGIALPKFLYS